MVEAESSGEKWEYGHEENPVDVGHVVHNGLLQVVEVVDALLSQPAGFLTDPHDFHFSDVILIKLSSNIELFVRGFEA